MLKKKKRIIFLGCVAAAAAVIAGLQFVGRDDPGDVGRDVGATRADDNGAAEDASFLGKNSGYTDLDELEIGNAHDEVAVESQLEFHLLENAVLSEDLPNGEGVLIACHKVRKDEGGIGRYFCGVITPRSARMGMTFAFEFAVSDDGGVALVSADRRDSDELPYTGPVDIGPHGETIRLPGY